MDRPDPDEIRPRITTLGKVLRALGVFFIGCVGFSSVADERNSLSDAWLWIDLGLAAVSAVVVTQRRRWPLTVALVTAAASAVSGFSAGPAVLAAVSLATRRVYWQIAVLAVASLVAGQTFVTVDSGNGEPFWLDLTVNALVTSAVLAWGLYIGSRRELIHTLRQRAERAEAEQAMRVAQARSNERARIAREMHDVLAHRISQISMHAGALEYRQDLDADALRASAGVIRANAHAALTDLRGVLGVLRDGGTGEVLESPQPTYADVPRLVDEARASGLGVDYDDDLRSDGSELPDVVGRTVFRIVQEGITNARKHAPGARLRIRVSGSPADGVDVELRNPVGFGPTATPGSGLGLVGLSERAELRGGRLETHHDGAVFVLHGWIPWAA